MAKEKPVHYVDNEKFLKEMIIYKREFDEAKSRDELPPIISEYLGDCFMKIAQRLSFRPNFINYAFRDDMISDGIENCVQYIRNFDQEKSKKKDIATLYDIADDLSYGSNHNYTLDHFEERKKIYEEERFIVAEYVVQLKT